MSTFYNCRKCNFYNDAEDYVCVECGEVNIYNMSKPDDNFIPEAEDFDENIPIPIPDIPDDPIEQIPIDINFDNIPLPESLPNEHIPDFEQVEDDVNESIIDNLPLTDHNNHDDDNNVENESLITENMIDSSTPVQDDDNNDEILDNNHHNSMQSDEHVINMSNITNSSSQQHLLQDHSSSSSSNLQQRQDSWLNESHGVLLNTSHYGEMLPNIFVKLKQNIIRDVQRQLQESRSCLTIFQGFTNNPLLSCVTLLLWGSVIFWITSYVSYHNHDGGDGDQPSNTVKNTYLAARIIFCTLYAIYFGLFFPIFDYLFGLRNDPICISLYQTDEIYRKPTTATQAAMTIRNEAITKAAVVRINDAYIRADIANNKGTDEQIGYNGLQLIDMLSSAQYSDIYLQIQVNTTFHHELSIRDACLQYYHNDPLLLTHTGKDSIEFPPTQYISQRLQPMTLLRATSMNTTNYTLLEDSTPSPSTTTTTTTSSSSNGSINSTRYGHQQQHQQHQQQNTREDATISWLLWNRITHFLMFVLMLEPIYLCIWHCLVKSIVVIVEREWRLVNPVILQERLQQLQHFNEQHSQTQQQPQPQSQHSSNGGHQQVLYTPPTIPTTTQQQQQQPLPSQQQKQQQQSVQKQKDTVTVGSLTNSESSSKKKSGKYAIKKKKGSK